MKRKLFWKLAPLFFCVSLPYLMGAQRVFPPEGLSISSMVNRSLLVFIGEVVDMEFAFRENLPGQFTTDITVKVEEMIKGEPNAGENLVKFMIPGGEGINPKTGKLGRGMVVGVPEFKKGEKIFIFLRRHKYLADIIPYGGLILGTWGKREMTDGLVSMPYTVNDPDTQEGRSVREILLPLDLTVQLARATLKDAKTVAQMDERIRAFAERAPLIPHTMPKLGDDPALVGSLKAEVQKILNQKEINGGEK